MSNEQIIEEIIRAFSCDDQTAITHETRLSEDLNLDSLDLYGILCDVEDECNVELADDVFDKLKTFGDVVRVVNDALCEDL